MTLPPTPPTRRWREGWGWGSETVGRARMLPVMARHMGVGVVDLMGARSASE